MEKRARSLAKVTQPLLPRYYPRKRVYDLLERAGEYPVTWVAGPAGSGKTTLVNSYLKEHGLQCLWYQIDEGDADPATLFYYLKQAIKGISIPQADSFPLLTPEYQPGLMTFALRWFEELFESIPEDMVLVFDNYQEAPEQSMIHAVLSKGMSVIPGGSRVIFISRKLPPSEFSRLDACQQMSIIGWNDLRLDPEETEKIAELLAPGYFSDKKVHDFHYLTGGWAAGVVLMVQKSQMEGADPHVFFRQSPEAVFDYFVSEAFNTLGEPVQDFLLKSVYLPRMSIKLAEDLTGISDARKILSSLRRYNYFIERRFHDDAVYSYHPLFRQFLLDRSKERFSREEILELINKAALLLEMDGQVEDALNLMIEAGGWETMSVFIMQHAKDMLDHGRHRTLEQWITAIPQEVLDSSPWLLFWLGASRFPFDPVASKEHFEDAYRQFKEKNDLFGFFLSWTGIAKAIIFGNLAYSRLDDLLEDLSNHREDFDAMPLDEIRSNVAGAMFAILAIKHRASPEVEEWAGLALDLARKAGDIDTIASTLFFYAYFHLNAGSLHEVAQDIEKLNKMAREGPMTEMRQVIQAFADMIYSEYSGLHERCIQAAEKGLEILNASGIRLGDVPFMGMAAMSCQDVRDYKRAEHYLKMLAQYEEEPRPWRHLILAVRSRQAMICGKYAEALLLAEHSVKLAKDYAMPFQVSLCSLLHAWVTHYLGDHEKTRMILSEIEAITRNTPSRLVWFSAKAVEAAIALEQGKVNQGISCLQEALEAGRESGFYVFALDHPSSAGSLCARALEVGIEVEYVKEMIGRRNLMPEEAPLTLEAWPWPLKIYTMGRFEIVRDGEPVQFARKAQKMPLELLKALVSAGGAPVSDTHIADILWPAAEGDLAMKSLATTLHRLRKLLGDHEAVQVQAGTLSLNRNLCWVDAWAFERVLDKADDLWKKAHGKEVNNAACEMTARALELYRGPYFEEEVWNPDAVSMGERMKERYFRSLYQLSDHLSEKGQWEKAREYLEAGLGVDDCDEGCYRRLMACLTHLGKKPEAISVFKRCKRMLEAKLDADPSPQTEAIAKSIRSESA
ncbi:MAG TPA: BTAD domain-containing putative transcriptional regulator [Deltaproteobacteria bacterium]|nr:BTAD domain-containing putative transcriptional regulator [Deltaproteobacteria bacterium]